MKKFAFATLRFFTIAFAVVGFGLTAAYVGVNLHLTDTSGIIDRQADTFWENGKDSQLASAALAIESSFYTADNYCALKKIKDLYPGTFWRVINLAFNGKEDLAQNNLNVAITNLNVSTNDCAEISGQEVSKKDFENLANMRDTTELFVFTTTPEWSFFKTGVVKDVDVLKRVENETGIKSRILVAMLVAEQMRLFHSDRAWFEQAIAPAKVLASMSQFSLGVLGIKTETAERIEKYAKDANSEFYPGPDFEHSLDFATTDPDAERFERLTDYHDHYYGYLYAALFCKEIIAQWKKSGIDISNRPEILATLYNIGFEHSVPKYDPQTGGAAITIDGKQYSFGGIAYNFYYSGQLLDEFPQ